MCGIAGALVFKTGAFSINKSYINRMCDVMAHRGPDGSGVWISPDTRIGLGHRRLSIIDLSESASQPMCNEDGTLWVSYNGEIYNHAEIRKELETLGGHRWKTDHSDTEVVLHAFEQWGIDCLEKFRGMFAIALWDEKARALWLIRDRIGIKPLYYSIHHNRITFASEIKALLKDPGQTREVNEEAFFHYLSFLTTPAPQTLFDGIMKLPNSTWLRVDDNGNVQKKQYWDVWNHTQPLTNISEEEISKRILTELRTSVRLRKVSDVPVGVFLSGGIDSSTNTALFSEDNKGTMIKTFSIGYEGDYQSYHNELHYARKMADIAGAEYHERLLNLNDLIEFLPRMVHLQDEPIADPVCVPVYYVSKLARDNGVIVCQVGEGADELFCGYPGWKTALAFQKLSDFPWPHFLKKLALKSLELAGMSNRTRHEWLCRSIKGQPIFWGGAEAFTEMQKKQLLSYRLKKKFHGYSSWEVIKPIRQRFEEKAWEKSHLNWMTYVDLNFRLPELLLMRIDKMSMGVSLEGRVPFLDHKLVELVMSIPTAMKIGDGTLKYILKKSVKNLIPDELIHRKKQGFAVPIYEWFFDRLGEHAQKELNGFFDQTDFLDRSEVNRLMNAGRGSQMWYLLNFCLWWKEYIA